MTIEFLILGRHMPSSRFRVLQYLPMLERAGIHCSVFTADSGRSKAVRLVHHLRALLAAPRHSLVFLQKPDFVVNHWLYTWLLFRLARRVVFDFDDAVFLDPATSQPLGRGFIRRLGYILRHSQQVIAGNEYLAGYARQCNAKVTVIPTAVDTDVYRPVCGRHRGRPPIIGWIGTTSNLAYLLRLIPVMKNVLRQCDCRFLIVSNQETKPRALAFSDRILYKPWRAEEERADLRSFDIGIMPLPDSAYTRGKCGFKLLQYMAVGIPVVASPVGVNRGIVADGVTGFLARSNREWEENLRRLCGDARLRRRLGQSGRRAVEKGFSLESAWQELRHELKLPSPPPAPHLSAAKKIAVFHAVFNSSIKGGGERLPLEIRNHFKTDLVAGSIDTEAWGKENSDQDSFVDSLWREDLGFHCLARESRIPGWRRIKRNFVFRFAPRTKRLNRYDLVIFSGDPARIPRRISTPKKVLYCHTPPRHLTDQKQDFLRKIPGLLRSLADLCVRRDLKRYIRDIRLMDLVIANSQNTRRRLLEYCGIPSQVVFPAVFSDQFTFLGQKDYYLSYARLDEWKRIRLIVAAFKRMPEKKLIVASSGPMRKWLEKEIMGCANITYVGQVSDERLARLLGHCIAGIYIPVNEDAGITPCELMAAGKPVIGVREGGLLETVIDRKTGVLIPAAPTVEDLIRAVIWLTPARALAMKEACLRRSRKYSKSKFFKKLADAIAALGVDLDARSCQ